MDLAQLDLAEQHRDRVDHHVDVLRQQCCEHLRRGAVGHVQQFDAGGLLEQFAGEVLRGGKARTAEHDLSRIGLGRGDQRLDVLVGGIRPDHDEQARGRDLPDPVERADRVIAHVLGDDRGDDLPGGLDAERVAILRSVGDQFVAEHAARARPIFHDHVLAELLLHALRQDAGDDVGAAAGAERTDDPDGLGRVVLGRRRRRDARPSSARRRPSFVLIGSCCFLPAAFVLPQSYGLIGDSGIAALRRSPESIYWRRFNPDVATRCGVAGGLTGQVAYAAAIAADAPSTLNSAAVRPALNERMRI